MSRKRVLTDEQKKEIVSRYKSGERRADLACAFNVSYGTVNNVISKLTPGESFHSRQGSSETLTEAQKEWAYKQYCKGYTQTEIAVALYCSPITINRAIAGRPRIKKPLHYDFEKEGA